MAYVFSEAALNLRCVVFLLREFFGIWVRPRAASASESFSSRRGLPDQEPLFHGA